MRLWISRLLLDITRKVMPVIRPRIMESDVNPVIGWPELPPTDELPVITGVTQYWLE